MFTHCSKVALLSSLFCTDLLQTHVCYLLVYHLICHVIPELSYLCRQGMVVSVAMDTCNLWFCLTTLRHGRGRGSQDLALKGDGLSFSKTRPDFGGFPINKILVSLFHIILLKLTMKFQLFIAQTLEKPRRSLMLELSRGRTI